MLKRLLNYIIRLFNNNRNQRIYKASCKEYRNLLYKQGYEDKPVQGQSEYEALWSQLTKKVDPYSYRLFSHYIGNVPYIIPDYIGRTILSYYLNPPRYSDYYEDKNSYSTYISDNECLPKTILCRINGVGYLVDYQSISKIGIIPFSATQADLFDLFDSKNICRFILKPTIDSCSGQGVLLFTKQEDKFVSNNGDILDGSFLKNYGDDFVIQEAITQHNDLALFNPSSVNTIRICTYRSIVDEQIHVSGALIRVGKKGAVIDNAHSGGCFVGIDLQSGKLQKIAHNQYGSNFTSWNSLDFKHGEYGIPNWEEVKKFAVKIAQYNKHSRLLALDITVDSTGTPRLIEINIEGFSYWLFLFCGQDIFVGQTQQVIDFCKERMQKDGRYKIV